MAYANLLNQNCTNKADFFKRVRDFICKRNEYSATGIGWTLHDSFYAVDENNPQLNDWFVIYSSGESGRENMYLHIKWSHVSYLQTQGWLYWNNITHVGTQFTISSTGSISIADTDTNLNLWIYGDLNSIFFGKMNSINSPSAYIGKMESVKESEDIGYCSSISSGTDRSATIDINLPSDWIEGAGVFIWDNNNIEKTVIKTINSGTKTITVDITNSYSNCRISRFLGYVTTAGINLTLYTLCGKNNTKAFSIGGMANSSDNYYLDTLDSVNKFILVPIIYSTTGGTYGKLRNIYNIYQMSPLVHKDILIDENNNEYRYFYISTSKYVVVKEV